MNVVGILPLDDRPATCLFPERIAAIAALKPILPPRGSLGNFLAPGDTNALADWLIRTAPDLDALIVAADMLAYGGLVASRRAQPSFETASARLSTLNEIHRHFPRLKILVASVIMRISLTAADKDAEKIYRDLIRYSEVRYRFETLGKLALREEKNKLEKQISPQTIREYDRTRERNYQINRALIEMSAKGIISDLVLLQEDASRFGPHLTEQHRLREKIRESGRENQILIYPGADEGTQTLLARWINRTDAPAVELFYSSESRSADIMPFEHCPLSESLSNHLRSANLRPGSGANLPCVWVHNPCTDKERNQAVRDIEALLNSGRKVAAADVYRPNGSDPLFMRMMNERGLLPELSAYAGWNTAGNTIGTVLAHLSAALTLNGAVEPGRLTAQRKFLWERIADDWGYQSVVRERIEADCRKKGIDCLSLGGAYDGTDAAVRRELSDWIRETIPPEKFGCANSKPTVRLPWARTFEVEVTLETQKNENDIKAEI